MKIAKGDILFHECLEMEFKVTAIGCNIVRGITADKKVIEGKKDDMKLIQKGDVRYG